MLLIYVVSGAVGFILSTLSGHQLTLGASAAVFGLLGALVVYGRRTGNRMMGQQVWMWAVVLFILGFVMPGVDNMAHLGGFLGGAGMARWLDPLKQETSDHLVAGLVALGLSLLSVVVSVIHAYLPV
jgi:rhomboid protease GluP